MAGSTEGGLAMIVLLATVMIVTIISVALVGLMSTDLTHASIQYGIARSFYVAKAGLEQAEAEVRGAADPTAYTTPDAGVRMPYGGGDFTYWVDAGPATGCGAGLKTLEAVGQVGALGRVIPARVRACAVPGAPFLTALFGVSKVEFQGAAQIYLAPYAVGAPGGGGHLGSFTEIHFEDSEVRLNALSEDMTNVVTVRDGRVFDYMLFGFSTRPDYNPTPMADPTPWILGVFGDLIKAQPTIGLIPNPCGTPYACVTVGNRITDVRGIPDLREANYLGHVYVQGLREAALPPLALDSAPFRRRAKENAANAGLNKLAGLPRKSDSHYTFFEIYSVLSYLALHPGQYLQGTVYVDGTLNVPLNMNLGGPSGNVTFAVGGDLVIQNASTLINTHDLTTVSGRRTPSIVVLGAPKPSPNPTQVCRGPNGLDVNGSGRLVMCEGSTLVADGLVYTEDGMMIRPRAFVDQVGAMYHNHRNTSHPSFTARDATVVVRFDPLALSVFGTGLATLSWQQLP
jgi:hypothetical protein